MRHPRVIAEYVRTDHEERKRLSATAQAKRAHLELRLGELNREIDRLVDAIAKGHGNPAVLGPRWFMRGQVGSDPGPSFNLARSWAHYGSNAGGPSVGVIVVWRHHVGKIVGHENGQWIIQSGNDGRAVRTRPRSIAGAIAFRRG
jgi:hypothetical protein